MRSPNKMTVFIIFLLAIALGYFYIGKPLQPRQVQNNWKGYSSIQYSLEGKSLKLLVADTEDKREKGLMNIRSLDDYDGMIFTFPTKDYQTFWNKNTLLHLTLYWISDDKVVGTSDLPSIETTKTEYLVNSPAPVNKVIEVPVP